MQFTLSPTELLVTALTHFRAALPEPREPHVLDVLLGLGLIALTILALVPPPTTTVRVFRAALAPLICFGWMYLSYVPLLLTPKERWGAGILFGEYQPVAGRACVGQRQFSVGGRSGVSVRRPLCHMRCFALRQRVCR